MKYRGFLDSRLRGNDSFSSDLVCGAFISARKLIKEQEKAGILVFPEQKPIRYRPKAPWEPLQMSVRGLSNLLGILISDSWLTSQFFGLQQKKKFQL